MNEKVEMKAKKQAIFKKEIRKENSLFATDRKAVLATGIETM